MMTPLMLAMCPRDDSIVLNQTILEALGHPRQVQLLINEETRMLVLRACTVDDQQAVVIPPERIEQFEISGRSLLKRIRKLTGWADDAMRILYGDYLAHHQAILFSLMDAQVIKDESWNISSSK